VVKQCVTTVVKQSTVGDYETEEDKEAPRRTDGSPGRLDTPTIDTCNSGPDVAQTIDATELSTADAAIHSPVATDLSTVVIIDTSTVVEQAMPTWDRTSMQGNEVTSHDAQSLSESTSTLERRTNDRQSAAAHFDEGDHQTPPTVDMCSMPTVDKLKISTKSTPSNSSPSYQFDLPVNPSKGDSGNNATRQSIDQPLHSRNVLDPHYVAANTPSPSAPPASSLPILRHHPLWITEQGDLIPEARVKRIRLAQDVLNPAEEIVYDTLWATKTPQTEDRESRVVQAGYDYLVKRTRLAKKTIQRVVAKLIDKDFLAIERPADIYKRTPTFYRVYNYKAVLDRNIKKGRSHVAKMGTGFCYVHPIDDPRLPSSTVNLPSATSSGTRPTNMTTVATISLSTVPNNNPSTEVKLTTDTVDSTDQSTVVPETTLLLGKDPLDTKTSSSAAIYQALSEFGTVDDDILQLLITSCKRYAGDCTSDEIIHFIEAKGSLIRHKDSRVHSPIGFLLTAVPKCFSGEVFLLYREEQTKQRQAEAAQEASRRSEVDAWEREQHARLADPKVSEEDKQFIRNCLGIELPRTKP
jgi:predicted transcriptional regulator